ncbi:AbrB/MazE/SpoVT family DNA-binding domain-containing protein [Kaistia dalseonensis]|uniref:Antitoxin MazE n=1 Tax=Kaistia dalseonensis TaxID=410840 RepID=A0ABU0HBN3_9HYPH|nr:AbrB/MazE/SpoVT family DNA-binding domain-containing protein [Kaistia dalseonensis]MCX5497085.1 AbrB/MazE/SpoVT family DNA-binding domain-containing protein [Kaistia dalseonensis]MDQ0439711.1 antitoxin MazE [Kaistia dalseonensis]
MRVKVAKWGNSVAVRIPKDIVDQAGLSDGQELDVETRGGILEFRPVTRRYTLEELLDGTGPAGPEGPPDLIEWGADRGGEALPDDAYARGEITYDDIVSGRDAARRR